MKISNKWFEEVPTARDLAAMNTTGDVRLLAMTDSAVCVKWKCLVRSPQYWIDKKWFE